MSVRCFTCHQDGKSAEDEEDQPRLSRVNRDHRLIFLVYRANYFTLVNSWLSLLFSKLSKYLDDKLLWFCHLAVREREREGTVAFIDIDRMDHGGWMHVHTRRRVGLCAVGDTHVAASRNSEESRNSGTTWNPTVTNSDTQDRYARVTRRVGALRDAASS